MSSLLREEKTACENFGTKLQKTILYGTRKDAQLEACIVPSVHIYPLLPKAI